MKKRAAYKKEFASEMNWPYVVTRKSEREAFNYAPFSFFPVK